MTLTQKITAAAALRSSEVIWREAGYDDESEPCVKALIGGARNENARLTPLLTALAECAEATNRAHKRGDCSCDDSFPCDLAKALTALEALVSAGGGR